jgi:hypothetical protein
MNKATLACCLLVNQRERNGAIGITQDTQLLRGLSAYVRNSNREDMTALTKRMVEAAWLKAMIDEHKVLADQLTDHIMANIEDADIRNEGVFIMKKLDAYISRLGEELEAIWLPS